MEGRCRISISAGYDSIVAAACGPDGGAFAWSSWKRSRPGDDSAGAAEAGRRVARAAVARGYSSAEIVARGPGRGREPAIRAVRDAGLEIAWIRDDTPIPHNGCRPPKRRRALLAEGGLA